MSRDRATSRGSRAPAPRDQGASERVGTWPVILPAMQPGHETLVRGRSPFAAAFLSLLFPGLGHVYLGAYRRGLGFAAPPLLFGALVAGFAVRMSVVELGGLALQQWFQVGVFIGNLV